MLAPMNGRNDVLKRSSFLLASLLLLPVGCDDGEPGMDAGGDEDDGGPIVRDSGRDTGPPPGDCEGPPGLYAEGSCDVLAEGVREFHPRYALWSDGADKDRFIFLPVGQDIDTRDADHWVYPEGTRIYKTFSLDGVRLETRLLQKMNNEVGPSAWTMSTFAWNEQQDAVTDVSDAPLAQRENVLGTTHNIPNRGECIQCHSAAQDVVNGFTAIQLNHDDDGVTLTDLIAEGRLTEPENVSVNDALIPGATIDGDETNQTQALGYLHANCGNCHRETRQPEPECVALGEPVPCYACEHSACGTGFFMWTSVAAVTPEETEPFATGVGIRSNFSIPDGPAYQCRFHPGDPGLSAAFYRLSNRGGGVQMPPLATEIPHPEGMDIISTWIEELTGSCAPPD
jgi:hypothetical protein